MFNSDSSATQKQNLFLKPCLQRDAAGNDQAVNQSCYQENEPSRDFLESEFAKSTLKRLMDVGIACTAMVVFLPLLALVAVAIRADRRGPVLYRQLRTGRHGSLIKVFKFRSMYHAREVVFQQATANDPRVTRVGHFIRRTSLDELPQLLNVIDGSMSLVVPRPHPPVLDAKFTSHIRSYKSRYEVKPGITGLAQIKGHRGETRQLSDMLNRVEQDRLYIDNWSLGLDLKILFTTALKGWVHKNAY